MTTNSSITVPAPHASSQAANTHSQPDGTVNIRWFTVAAILIGGFFLASTPARNSDLWLWLATGRAVVNGTAHFGVDPFAYTTEGVRWVNSSWLASVLLYLTYANLGGVALVAIKAALFTATFALTFWGAMARGRWLMAALLTALAVIASGTSVPLRPAILAYPLLALTAVILFRPTSPERTPWQSHWVLLPLFALWANLNEWFVLGPALLALFVLGQLLTTGRKGIAWLGLAMAGFGVCLLNPYLFRVFQLPPELALWGVPGPLLEESAVRFSNIRVYSNTFVFPAKGTINPAAVAFALLSVISLATIARSARISRFTRLLIWVLFFALAVVHARAMPFFAIISTILAGISFQPLPGEVSATNQRGPRWYVGLGLILLGVAFVLSSWTGWLQTPPYGPRSWSVEPDPGLRKAAEQICVWRAEGKIPADDRVFPLSLEAAHHLIWFCPGERVFLDQRWELYGGAAEDYLTVRNHLIKPSTPQDDTGWEKVLRKYHIGIILAHDSDRVKADQAVGLLASTPKSWAILGVDGRSALFGWKESGISYASLAVNLDRLAFSPQVAVAAPSNPAPRIRIRHWLDALDRPLPAPQLQSEEANEYVSLFDGIRKGHRATLQQIGTFHVATYVGLAASGIGPSAPLALLTLPACPPTHMGPIPKSNAEYTYLLGKAIGQDASDGPIAPLLLAIRSGRQAVSEQPENAIAYFALGQAYLGLAELTRERIWIRELPEFAEIRRDQAITALTEAIRLNPNMLEAHLSLVAIFNQKGAHDLSLREMKEILRITKANWIGGDTGKEERIKVLQNDINRLETMVEQLRQRIPAEHKASVLVRAETAFGLGLYGDSLDILLKADYSEFGDAGLRTQVEALLFSGRAADVLEWIKPSHRDAFALLGYNWARARAAACVGDYAEFDFQMLELKELLIHTPASFGSSIPLRIPIAQEVGRMVLNSALIPWNPGQFQFTTIIQHQAVEQTYRLSNGLRQGAKGDVLRGILALEQGDVARSERLLRDALQLWTGPRQVELGQGMDFIGRPVAVQILQLIREAH